MIVKQRVHGIANAAGCQLVASCDLAFSADTARFATPGEEPSTRPVRASVSNHSMRPSGVIHLR